MTDPNAGPTLEELRRRAAAVADRPPGAIARLRGYFVTGLIVAGPVAITIYVVWWIVALIDGWVKPLVPPAYLPDAYLPVSIPGVGLVIALVGLTLIGFLTANLVGRTLLDFSETALARMPVVRGLYKGVKQLFETVFSQSGDSFRRVALVEFPVPGTWSLVFVSSEAAPAVAAGLPEGETQVGVFLPCSPNPTTGFFFYLPRSRLREIDVPVEAAAKLIMSAGVIQPDPPSTAPLPPPSPRAAG